MTDTAQSLTGTAETDAIAQAADAFKAFTTPVAERARAADGKFVSQAPAEPEEEIETTDEGQPEAVEESEVEQEDEAEAADEVQPEPVEMPSSWAKEDAEIWSALTPEAQARIREREGERDTAVNLKFQEAANIRKANEALIAEAQANREKFIKAADDVLALVALDRPTPQQFGAGTGNYDRESYDLAVSQYEQASQVVETVRQQREAALAQQQSEAEAVDKAAFDEVESQFRPKLLALVPELTDPQKAGQTIGEIARYAIDNGIPEHVFADPRFAARVTSPELTMAWKAMQWDKQQAAKGRVQPVAQARPASPTVKPGVATSRTAIEHQKRQKNMERLDREGSVEAGAAFFKDVFKGK